MKMNLNYEVPQNITRARIDVGTCMTAPNAAFWFDKYDLRYFCSEIIVRSSTAENDGTL